MWAFNPKRTTRMHSSHSVVNIKINMKEPIPKTRPNLPGNHRLSPKTAKERKLYEQKQWDIYIENIPRVHTIAGIQIFLQYTLNKKSTTQNI